MTIGISVYSVPVTCGLLRRADAAVGHPRDAFGIAALAAEHGLATVEMPLVGMLPDLSHGTVDRLRDTLKDYGLKLVVDTAVVDLATLKEVLPLAARAGATVVRAMLSTILEGARATVPGGWAAYLKDMQQRVVALRPLLEANDLVLAVENHQDLTSDEMVELCLAGGPHIGLTLDVANPLAVAEEPLEFARKIVPWLRNVHLKDYRIYPTTSGYRLVRCALGEGVIPFPELLALFASAAPDAPLHIELAAHYARHIRLLEDDWWQGYPPRDVRTVLPVLRSVARNGRPADEPWQTPWEQQLSPDECAAYEHTQLAASIAYLRLVLSEGSRSRVNGSQGAFG